MQTLAYLGSPTQWFILAIICLIVFGASRLPEIARNLGKSLGILRQAKRDFEQELMNAEQAGAAGTQKDHSPELEAQAARHDPANADQPSEKQG